MDLLQSSDFAVDSTKVNLYFDTYQYKVSTFVKGVHFFRYHKSVDTIEFRLNDSVRFSRYNTDTIRSYTRDTISEITAFIGWRNIVDKALLKVCVSRDHVVAYSNDLQLLSEFVTIVDSSKVRSRFLEARRISNFQRDVVYQKKPTHKFRMFLNSRPWSYAERQELLTYFTEYDKEIKPSPSLMTWCNRVHKYTPYAPTFSHGGLFVDYIDSKYITFMVLKFPDISGKVFEIVQR